MLRNPLFIVGITLCSIGALLLIPLSKEISYDDKADSNALISAIAISATVAHLLSRSPKKSCKIFDSLRNPRVYLAPYI
jgi:hypothetical protein